MQLNFPPAVVRRRAVFYRPRFIIYDTHEFVRFVHAVDLSAEKGSFHDFFRFRHPIERAFHLPERRCRRLHPFGKQTRRGVFARTRIGRITIRRRFQEFRARFPRVRADFLFRCKAGKFCGDALQQRVHEVARIGCHNALFLAFFYAQPVAEKMFERAGKIRFQRAGRYFSVAEKQRFTVFHKPRFVLVQKRRLRPRAVRFVARQRLFQSVALRGITHAVFFVLIPPFVPAKPRGRGRGTTVNKILVAPPLFYFQIAARRVGKKSGNIPEHLGYRRFRAVGRQSVRKIRRFGKRAQIQRGIFPAAQIHLRHGRLHFRLHPGEFFYFPIGNQRRIGSGFGHVFVHARSEQHADFFDAAFVDIPYEHGVGFYGNQRNFRGFQPVGKYVFEFRNAHLPPAEKRFTFGKQPVYRAADLPQIPFQRNVVHALRHLFQPRFRPGKEQNAAHRFAILFAPRLLLHGRCQRQQFFAIGFQRVFVVFGRDVLPPTYPCLVLFRPRVDAFNFFFCPAAEIGVFQKIISVTVRPAEKGIGEHRVHRLRRQPRFYRLETRKQKRG